MKYTCTSRIYLMENLRRMQIIQALMQIDGWIYSEKMRLFSSCCFFFLFCQRDKAIS